jgi:hypothetical protein
MCDVQVRGLSDLAINQDRVWCGYYTIPHNKHKSYEYLGCVAPKNERTQYLRQEK